MKYIFALVAITIVYAAAAQDNNYLDLLKRYKKPFLKLSPKFESQLSNTGNSFYLYSLSADRLLTQLSNGTKIYRLPQDNMPCLVPDMNQFNMPNVGYNIKLYKYPEPGSIPNPVFREITFISMKRDMPAR